MKKKITLNYPKSAAMRFFQGTQERVRNSRGKRAISVLATEVLLYLLVSIFSNALSTFVESKADVSMYDRLFFSKIKEYRCKVFCAEKLLLLTEQFRCNSSLRKTWECLLHAGNYYRVVVNMIKLHFGEVWDVLSNTSTKCSLSYKLWRSVRRTFKHFYKVQFII